MQQKQQPASYDLLAVFPDENKAETASSKLLKEGFKEDEVYRLVAGSIGAGTYREHRRSNERRDYFLQTQRSGPNITLVILLAVVLAIVLGLVTFLATFEIHTLVEPITSIVGVVVGLVLGAVIGLSRRGRVRGAIGQTAPSMQEPVKTSRGDGGPRTVVALRFDSPENISRNSRARAILLNNEGKIDRSVTRQD
jgi:hypothetical protein